jgi:hypothetical protein
MEDGEQEEKQEIIEVVVTRSAGLTRAQPSRTTFLICLWFKV